MSDAKSTDFLTISEDFYSIQGEGTAMGVPSVFLRLTGCNLTCKGWSYVNDAGEHLGCDSADVWRTGTKQLHEDVFARWRDNGWLEELFIGAHLIVTGGEPLLQQNRLTTFLTRLSDVGCAFVDEGLNVVPAVYTEVETNGTIIPDDSFAGLVDHWNVSAKLSNNGDPREKRHVPEALQWHAYNPHSYWKFVICDQNDIKELFSEFIEPFNLDHNKIWLMPEGTTDEELKEKAEWIAELCKQHCFNFSHRLQVYIWGQVTGV